ncbi:MAG: Copper-exporting P-type ATPase B [Methanosaeta sp. PtaB.Bin039]|nr:MAG: Copper-exporting P-type ATPase B [Methanosaeta sp. PtaB.Bin039]HOT08039.1 magnesium-translocating P-type ATPase [Methanotrichaceae archaeon]HQF17732.1 magnesium-translocating P-type ATPase [Methanotrichaceae archaeon]HQI92355.1 magnesium-translocating P-type ATPase [Methanotrichaceae archaeon]
MDQQLFGFWSVPSEELLARLKTTKDGLTQEDARMRQKIFGQNVLRSRREHSSVQLLLSQFRSPIILLLVFAAGLSIYLHEGVEAGLILIIIFVSGLLGFWQERRAADAMKRLLVLVQVRADLLRDGKRVEIPLEEVVPGDIVVLNAGDIIPADALILGSKDLFVDESALTGETYPAEKMAGILPVDTPISRRTNSLFLGTSVVSGTALALVVLIGSRTELGRISRSLELREPESEFEQGVRRFGYLLMEITLLLVMTIFAINVYLARPIIESFLFALALAVGLTPQLLPVIISVNLAHGARQMASQKVIVKRPASIENFGSMDILCCDKTGTLTEGKVKMRSALDVNGQESEEVLRLAYINAFFETGFANPIDQSILDHISLDMSGLEKLDEVPYDFIRKRLSVLILAEDQRLLVTKGALANVLEVCTSAKVSGAQVDLSALRERIDDVFHDLSDKGFRVLGLSCKSLKTSSSSASDENDMVFLGFLVFFDPPKDGVAESIRTLSGLGVSLKLITGDNRLIAASIAREVGLPVGHILTGGVLLNMGDEALQRQVVELNVFAEVEPTQKERVIRALRRKGSVVGYMGDGINDASALHAADIGISVDSAVDVAKEAADIVLLDKDLGVLSQGVLEGRKTFSNTMKYVFMATSANFGNMFSMALLSIFLPFLPMLPIQVLLTNLLTDLPEMAIAGDSVDPEQISAPRRWSIGFIREFMIVFGLLSSIFDYLTFGALLFILHASVDQFRTAWFIESVVSACMVVLVIRTRRPFFRSSPGRYLIWTTLMVVVAAILLPYTSLAAQFKFIMLPSYILVIIATIVLLYVIVAEFVKMAFYRRTGIRGS